MDVTGQSWTGAGHAPPTRRRALPPRRMVTATTIVVGGIWLLLDQATKLLAERVLADGRVIDLGVIDLNLVYNPNGAFSIPGFPGLFVGVTVFVVIIVARALRHTDRLSLAVAYGLVVGGALGNVVDRITNAPGFPNGEVVDFLDLGWWPVFNIADIGIVTGAVLVVLLATLADREERARQRAQERQDSVRPDTATVGTRHTSPPSVGTRHTSPPSVGTRRTSPPSVGTRRTSPPSVGTPDTSGPVDTPGS